MYSRIIGLTVYVVNDSTNNNFFLFLDKIRCWARAVTMESYIHFNLYCRGANDVHESIKIIYLF